MWSVGNENGNAYDAIIKTQSKNIYTQESAHAVLQGCSEVLWKDAVEEYRQYHKRFFSTEEEICHTDGISP